MRQEKLHELISMIEIMKTLTNEDVALSIWNEEGEVLYCNPPRDLSINFEVGYKLKDKSDILFEVIRTGKPANNRLPKEAFGMTIEGKIVPVFDEGKSIGCIVSSYSVERREELERKSEKISNFVEGSRNTIYEILNATVSTSDNLNKVNTYVNELEKSVSGDMLPFR